MKGGYDRQGGCWVLFFVIIGTGWAQKVGPKEPQFIFISPVTDRAFLGF